LKKFIWKNALDKIANILKIISSLGMLQTCVLKVLMLSPLLWLSVADPGCLSQIPDPDFYPSRIPDPKTATKERGEKKFVVIYFFIATNFTKCKIILFLN
jgi:hypothetical protein